MKNKKGLTLIEVVLSIAILGVITSVIYGVFQFGINSYYSGSRQVIQQDIVVDTIQILRSKVEESKTIDIDTDTLIVSEDHLDNSLMTINSSEDVQCWRFNSGSLQYKGVGETTWVNVINGLVTDTSEIEYSEFIYNRPKDRLIIKIKPDETNEIYKNRNVKETIISEISVRYKVID